MATASTISIQETIDLLEGQFGKFADGFASGMYALWLGSAISRDRVVGLDGVLAKLLESLRQRVENTATCPHFKAFSRILDLAELTPEQRGKIDFSTPLEQALEKIIVDRLWTKYSKVLGTEVEGKQLDYLLWDVLDFKNTFASQHADAEHLAIGMLVLEGVISDIATANWDALLEAAMDELGHTNAPYTVAVTGDDLKGPKGEATLYKFHGCARRAIEDEPKYRPLLVAREAAINQWMANPSFEKIRVQLGALLQRARTIMIGMSAQDSNIQLLFGNKGWKWDDEPSPIIFSAQELSEGQKSILEGAYPTDYEANRNSICGSAKFPAYAKALLLALLLYVLGQKLQVLTNKVSSAGLDAAAKDALGQGIKALRNKAAEAGDGDRYELARSIAQVVGRHAEQFFAGRSENGARPYVAIHSKAPHLMSADKQVEYSGQIEAAAALGAIGLEVSEKKWDLSLDNPSANTSGTLKVSGPSASARVFFASTDDRINGLIKSGAFSPNDADVVVVCSGSVTQRRQRSPRAPMRDGRLEPRYLGMEDILKDSVSLGDFRQRFAGEVGL
ncbi:SIR2 family protein [Ensifer adhaerens]|uniref:SIR2 family protein n=1 Tax=Ensifer adhaerens TaxID=106592 RepID=A0A9Q8YFA4_ENSAD|nr:SIR2 family protein [Ensifer adhaerens]USJ27633.1 SIR2 family protein [Ensifer adhaerens]